MILDDKKAKAKDKLRAIIADELAQKTLADMPASMIDSELNRIEAQFNADIERMGVKMDDYLKHAKKSLEDIRKEWRPHAEKKAKIQLIINQISDTEKIKPSKEEIEEEVKHILNHYKDADREKATIYAETVLTNDKVFRFLEEIK
jgi:trigger factor